jgi:sodium/potassium-transporting ATPase subunit alpha
MKIKHQVYDAMSKITGEFRHLIEKLELIRKIIDPMQKCRDKKSEERRKNMKPHEFHKLSNDELAKLFKTSLTQGLNDSEINQLLVKNGKNELKKVKSHKIRKTLGYIFGGFNWILWISFIMSIVAYCITEITDPSKSTNIGLAVLIILVIGLQAIFEAFQDWSSSKVMKSIKNLMPSEAIVIRNGVEVSIPVCDLVVGDIVILTNGTKVPADLRLIESNDLKFDRSMITGESEAIEGMVNCTDEIYSESKNISFMTSLVTNGNGKGLVLFLIFFTELF